MSNGGGGGWVDRIISGCVGLLVASFALFCALRLLESVLPVLMGIVGVVALGGLAVGGIVVFRTWRDRW